jgi:peptidoglycan/xylan/chitin deacetylase (PgdA/CDA1 family)
VYDSQDDVVVTQISSELEKTVVLTFDDGPSKVLTQILDVLKSEQVQAVFFWQSRLLYAERPWNRVLNEGHLIGTHSTRHLNLVKLSFEEQYKELKNSVTKIETIIGQRVKYFRPPFGQYNQDTLRAASELNLTPIMWRISSMDWELKDNPQQIIANVADQLEDGSIILLHELRQTVEILPELIKKIKEQGYQFKVL